MRGMVSYKLIREDGTVVEKYGCNTIPSIGMDRMSQFLVEGNRGTGGIHQLEIGDSLVFFSDPNRLKTLVRPRYQLPIYQKVYLEEKANGQLVTSDRITNKVSYRFRLGMYDPYANLTITEMGLFTKDGTLFAYKQLDEPIEKRVNDIFMVDWIIILHSVTGIVPNYEIEYNEFWKMDKPLSIQISLDYVFDKGVALQWNSSNQVGVVGYNVYRKEYPNEWYNKINEVRTDIGNTQEIYRKPHKYVDTSIEWGKLYSYNLKVLNVSDIESDLCQDVIIPAIHLQGYSRDGKAELYWSHISNWDKFKHYKVYRMISGTQSELLTTTTQNVYNVNGLTNGGSYLFAVSVVDTDDVEYPMSYIVPIIPQKDYPDTPNFVSADSLDEGVMLLWQPVEDAASYDLYRVYQEISSQMSNTIYSLMSNIDGTMLQYNMLSQKIYGLTNEEDYMFVLKSLDEEQDASEFSNMVVGTPHMVLLPAPQNIRAIIGDGTIRLDWSDVQDAAGYRIYVNYAEHDITTNNYYTLTSLLNNMEYSIRVHATDERGRDGMESATVLATPIDNQAPNAPTNLQYFLDNTVIYLSWRAVVDSQLSHYNVYGSGGDIGELQKIVSVVDTSYQHVGVPANYYNFYITAVDMVGNESTYSIGVTVSL